MSPSNHPLPYTPLSARTRLRRQPERGRHDREAIDAILDEGRIAHVGFVRDGRPAVIPTLYLRRDDEILLHGSPASGVLRAARSGQELCVEVTLLDGLVLARSAFHHSANYRSVVIYGHGRMLDADERSAALDAFVDRLVPGRRPHLRPTTAKEVASTAVVAVPLDEASAKVRTGPPIDDEEDYELDIWAGVLPLTRELGEPVADPRNRPGAQLPEHLRTFTW